VRKSSIYIETDGHPHRSEVAGFSFRRELLLAPTGPLSDVDL